MKTLRSLLSKYFWYILLALALIFFISIAAGAPWGLPAIWHADEQLHQVMPALANGRDTVSLNVFYPTLPFFTMVAAGEILSHLTTDVLQIMAGIRIISAVLGSLVILLTAFITLATGRSRSTALIAASLVMFSSGFATIAHHAIVDIYLAFFVTLATFLLAKFVASKKNIWLYLGFFAIGLAASSKYNGASLLLAATLFPFLFGAADWRSDLLRPAGRLILAYFLAFVGFFIGTPRAILNAASHLEQLMSFLERQRIYAGPERPLGIIGQWGRVLDGLGLLMFLLFIIAAIWAVVQAGKYVLARLQLREFERGFDNAHSQDGRFYLALLLILIAFELPLALSQFYPMRYMVPAYPLLAVLSAMMLHDLWRFFEISGRKTAQQMLVPATLAVIFFSALRFVSVILIFANDSRTAASKTLEQMIPPASRTEYTLYPPHLPVENRVIDNYPLKVFKFEEDIIAHTGWNMGEEGIEMRKPDYLVVDRKTYARFEDDHVCSLNPVECRFFARLLNEETNYRLVQRFEYRVPPYFPQVKTDFANIEVLLFERLAEPIGPDEEEIYQNPLDVQFGENIFLRGYDLAQTGSGGEFNVSLFWITRARLAENYKVFVHCLDANGEIVAQSDSIPASGMSPTEYWMKDQIVKDEHTLELPDGYSNSECHLQAGLYSTETGERLPSLMDGKKVEDGATPLQNNSS